MAIKNSRDKFARVQIEHEHRINGRITAREVRLIDAEGNQLGICSKYDALNQAEDLKLDLVEISPNASPPVCKIMNYGKFLYEKKKKDKINKQNSKASELKEITIRPAIEDNDLQVKLKHARKFLEDGDKVKVVLKLKGREARHSDANLEVLKKFVESLSDISKLEQGLKTERMLSMVILQPREVTKQ